ncbi:MAG: exodeoxyribonuclease VII small subunit [Hydrogenophaga sp.]|nr:exodeoxyribonuclease VII small subunit [Hydrogenophaga sp.]
MTSPATPKSARSTRSSDKAEPAASYESALDELENLVAQLENGQLPLDQLLGHYQRGAELLAFCRARLDAVEHQIKVLEDGEPKPWDGQ